MVTDYQPTEQDSVLLDYAKTRHDKGPEAANKEFQWGDIGCPDWRQCTEQYNPIVLYKSIGYRFRRKPRLCTLTGPDGREWELPVLTHVEHYGASVEKLVIFFSSIADTDTAYEALREMVGGENG